MRGLLLCLLLASRGGGQELLRNGGATEVDGPKLIGWSPQEWKTGGRPTIGQDGKNRCFSASAGEASQRAGWQQIVDWPDDGRLLAITARYRSEGVAKEAKKGASLRITCLDKVRGWDLLGIQQSYYPPATDWTTVHATYEIVPGTKRIVIEVLHWFTPGRTDWDDLSARAVEGPSTDPARPRVQNGSFEDLADDGVNPRGWAPAEFGTGATFELGQGGHTGERCLVLRASDAKQRCCYQQRLLWSDQFHGLTVSGWYRTRGFTAAEHKGASVRFIFNHDPTKWVHLALQTVYLAPADDWTPFQATAMVPAGTMQAVIELFHWYIAGETQFDDVTIRPATNEELRTMPLEAQWAIDREPTPGRSVGYAPTDGGTAELNPPPFKWLPSGPPESVKYRLQVSRTEKFDDQLAVDLKDWLWCAKMLTEPLATGTWFWRYGVDRERLPTLWSQARRFEITDRAQPWPFPKPSAFTVPQERPRLFITAKELPSFRERAKSGDLKSIADSLVAAVHNYAGEELVPEPAFLPKDPAERGKAYTLTFRATRPPMDRMEQSAFAYLLTADKACGEEARRRLVHFFSWDPHGSTGIFHNDEPAMWIMMRGSRAYDWAYDLLTPDERSKVESCMRERAADYYQQLSGMPFENNPYSSHPGRTIGFLGEAALSFQPDWPEAGKWLEYISTIYWGVYPAWGKDDGGWNEGPGYWSAYMSFGLHFVLALKQATGVDLSQRPFFHQTPYYRLYVTPPGSQMSPFGDGTQWKGSSAGALMYWFSTLTQDPVLRWYPTALGQGSGSDIMGVVLKDDSLQPEPPVALSPTRLFPGVGLAVLRTDLVDRNNDVGFLLKSSPYGAVSHGHNEQNCFVLEAYGEALAVSTGYYNRYGSPHHDGWTRQTKAKNGITYDGGQSQERGWDAQGKITAFVGGEQLNLVCGDATKAYGGRLTRAIREVVQLNPDVFVIRDDVADDEAHRYEFQLHAVDEMKVDSATRTVVTTRPKATLTTRFLAPDDLKLTQTDQFEPPPTWPPNTKYENNWHLTAAYSEPAKAGQFLTVLLPARAGHDAELPKTTKLTGTNGTGVEVKYPDGASAIVAFRNPAAKGDLTAGALRTNARLAAVRRGADGAISGWLLSEGTTLDYNGKALASLTAAATVTASVGPDGGRIDSDGEPTELTAVWTYPVKAVTRAGARLDALVADGMLKVNLDHGPDQLQVWSTEPTPPGKTELTVKVGHETTTLTGQRYGRGQAALSGRVSATPGRYTLPDLPSGRLTLGHLPDGDHVWLTPREDFVLRGTGLPQDLVISPDLPGIVLSAQHLSDLPDGIVFEAETGYAETGGTIKVSGGGHEHASGNNNLWSWNTIGHALSWTLKPEHPGRYELWFVGASEGGFLATLQVGDATPLALWFNTTGGWARKNADEWRAYRVLGADGRPVASEFPAKVTLTDRSGMGLNLDRLVLVKAK